MTSHKSLDPVLAKAVEDYVRNRFHDVPIEVVTVVPDFDAYGDEILNVTIVFDEAPRKIGIGRLTRSLWGELSKHQVEAFPVLSFMSSEENARLSAAA